MNYTEDILRKIEEFRSGDIHQVADRYWSGNMSMAEIAAFKTVVEKYPDLKEEVHLQGLALRAAKVANRSVTLEKLEQASLRAKQRTSLRNRQRLTRNMFYTAVSLVAAFLILAILAGWGRQGGKSLLVPYADVNAFGLLGEPNSSSTAMQARLFKLNESDIGVLQVEGSYRLGWVNLKPGESSHEAVSSSIGDELWRASRDFELRRSLCREMRRLGLHAPDPLPVQNRRWEREQETQWAGRALNYPMLSGFLSEEDPDLDLSSTTQIASLPENRSQEAESGESWRWQGENNLDGF